MTPDEAKKIVLPFGKYRGKTLEQIADDDPLYLDWLAGIERRGALIEAVPLVARAYAREIEEAIGDRE